jgi:hypothetical protein
MEIFMKNLLILVLAIITTSTFAQSISDTGLCEGRGQQEILKQVRIIEEGISNGEIDAELANFFMVGIESMQENLDYICEGIPIPQVDQSSARQKQLNIIQKGIENGDIDAELAQYFLNNLSDFSAK